MRHLDLTFNTLAISSNEAAVNVLSVALHDTDASVRQRALRALASRKEPRCGRIILEAWSELSSDDQRLLRNSPGQLVSAVGNSLRALDELAPSAIESVRALHLDALLPELVDIAETHASHAVRRRATQVVVELAEHLGEMVRAGREKPSVRNAAAARLARSVEHLDLHRNRDIVDAFLLVSTCRDSQLLRLLADHSPHQRVLVARLRASSTSGVASLLASFIGRAKMPAALRAIIAERDDTLFRSALLQNIGAHPSDTTLQNLRAIGEPACCVDAREIAATLPPTEHAALLHLFASTRDSTTQLLQMTVSAVQRGEAVVTDAATQVLQRCEPLDEASCIDTAIELAGHIDSREGLDEQAQLLGDLIDLLGHPDHALHRAVRRILAPLHTDSVLPRLTEMKVRDRHLLGSLLVIVDPTAIGAVRDRMRHPVLQQRLQGIAAADALGVVDRLIDAFAHVVRSDHQEARRLAAEALATAKGSESLALLEEMATGPQNGVQDEAARAVRFRHRSVHASADSDRDAVATSQTQQA